MLRAKVRSGDDVLARRDLPRDAAYRCPLCEEAVTFKPGRSVTPHFAHRTGSDCSGAGESRRHMEAKLLLERRFRAQGYQVVVEESHLAAGRRVDVAVTVPTGHRVAVEIQDSKIDVNTMKSRMKIDRRLGFFATVWVFTSNRLPDLTAGTPACESRVPDELRWVTNRTGQPVFVLDTDSRRLYAVSLRDVIRYGETYHDTNGDEHEGPSIILKNTKTPSVDAGQFTLSAVTGKYAKPGDPDWTAVFDLALQDATSPWTVHWWQHRPSPGVIATQHFTSPPVHGDERAALRARCRQLQGDAIQLQHNASGRLWLIETSWLDDRELSRWVPQQLAPLGD